MWKRVNQFSNRGCTRTTLSHLTATQLNDHYARISTDSKYLAPGRKHAVLGEDLQLTEWTVFKALETLRHTATGLDKLPAWFLRLGAPVFAKSIAKVFAISLSTSTVPTQWKQAIIRPVNEIPIPKNEADYRPISITPVLSRLMERLVVRNYIYPASLSPPPSLSFSDQYAFRPTGSTTAAVISLLNNVTKLLAINSYVIVYGLDFSKTFDTVRHSTLLQKIALLICQTSSTIGLSTSSRDVRTVLHTTTWCQRSHTSSLASYRAA